MLPDWNFSVPKSSHQRKWMEKQLQAGQHPILVAVALQAVAIAEELADYLERLDKRHLPFRPVGREVLQWHKWSQNRTQFWNHAIDHLFADKSSQNRPSAIVRLIRIKLSAWERMSPENRLKELKLIPPELFRELQLEAHEMFRVILDDMLLDAYHPEQDSEQDAVSPEGESVLKFLLAVVLPVYFDKGILHDELYWKAVGEDDFESLLTLIQLNPIAEQLPGIAQKLTEYARDNQTEKLDEIDEVKQKRPRHLGREPKTNVKCALIAIVVNLSVLSVGSQRIGNRMKVPDMRRLFDAHAADVGKKLCDEDLQPDPASFTQMVKRYRKRLDLRFWDIFSCLNVPVT